MRSLLVGNGFDIQLGGQDFANKWIIVRLIADALSGETDALFISSPGGNPSVDGSSIVGIINEFPTLSIKAINGEYDNLKEVISNNGLSKSLESFKSRYPEGAKSPEEIGLEDWFLLIHLFLYEQSDLIDHYPSIKQGFESLLLNAIYCHGKIQQLWRGINPKTKNYIDSFDKIFTVNYDSTLDKLTEKPVFHLHGDFETKHDSENPQTARGFLRKEKGESIWFSERFQHCNTNAILDYSGSNKYKLATAFSKMNLERENIIKMYNAGYLSQYSKYEQEVIKIGMEKNLPFGYDYHFDDLKNLSGELTIIGLALANDSHIIDCINVSNVSKVIYYGFKPQKLRESSKLPFTKPFEIKDVSDLWKNLGLQSPKYQSPVAEQLSSMCSRKKKKAEEKIRLVNTLVGHDEVDYSMLIDQLRSIPEETERALVKFLYAELSKQEYHEKVSSIEQLGGLFQKFANSLSVSTLSPQTLLFLYFTYKSLEVK